jgi:hypothetical protein
MCGLITRPLSSLLVCVVFIKHHPRSVNLLPRQLLQIFLFNQGPLNHPFGIQSGPHRSLKDRSFGKKGFESFKVQLFGLLILTDD